MYAFLIYGILRVKIKLISKPIQLQSFIFTFLTRKEFINYLFITIIQNQNGRPNSTQSHARLTKLA